jgi:hypothetical protein
MRASEFSLSVKQAANWDIDSHPFTAYALVAHLNWRWAFYVGIMANSIALTLTAVFYWPPGFLGLHLEGKTRWQQIKEIDFIGLFLFGGGLTIFLLGVSWGNNPYLWKSVHVLAPLVLGGMSCS